MRSINSSLLYLPVKFFRAYYINTFGITLLEQAFRQNSENIKKENKILLFREKVTRRNNNKTER